MRLSRRRGRLRLSLQPAEAQALTGLLDELAAVAASEDADDAVVARLYPSGYADDPEAEVEFRSLTAASLRSVRAERIAACAGELAVGGDLDLSEDDDARRWIQVLNDLRLALGTRLGVSEDEAPADPTDPEQQPRLVYQWLTALQDAVVSSLLDAAD